MAYTFGGFKVKSGISDFGGLRTDANRIALTGNTGNFFQTKDATSTAVTSPVSVNGDKTLTVPVNASSIKIASETNPVRVSEDSTYSCYFTVPAGEVFELDCANQAYVYLQTTGATTINFAFKCI